MYVWVDSVLDNTVSIWQQSIHIYKTILFFRDSVRSFFSSWLKYAVRGTGTFG